MFIDQAKIQVKAGNGGNGIVSFHKDKLHPKGIPDGGNGGDGGSIIFEIDEGLNTLQQYKYRPFFKAQNGKHGGSNKKNGKRGEDLILKVPPGTVIINKKTGNVLFDLTSKGQHFIAVKGGIGGRGNASFATARYKAPHFAQKGEPGKTFTLKLELKVLADVGIVGFPNAGKSTLISVISKAKPKIADYPFTTLTPNLGVVTAENYDYVVADIPGLIEGAHKGKGLGDMFLKHVERAGILLYLLDASSDNPLSDYKALYRELKLYSKELAKRYKVVALNKIDLLSTGGGSSACKLPLINIEKYFNEKEIPFFKISALKKQGLHSLIEFLGSQVKEHKQPLPETEKVVYRISGQKKLSDFKIEKKDNIYKVTGEAIERLVIMTDIENEEAVKYLHIQFDKVNLDEHLAAHGVKEGDIVEIAGVQFDFKP